MAQLPQPKRQRLVTTNGDVIDVEKLSGQIGLVCDDREGDCSAPRMTVAEARSLIDLLGYAVAAVEEQGQEVRP